MKKKITIVFILAIATLFAGCTAPNQQSTPSTLTSANQAEAVDRAVASPAFTPSELLPSSTPSPTVSWPSPKVSSDPVTYQNEKQITVEYYDVVEDKNVTATYEISGDTSAKTGMDAVNDVYLQKILGGDGIKTNSIVYKDGNIYIDFTDSIYKLNLGSGGEAGVLDSIADAYLNNVEGAKAVYYSVNGNDYSTGHIEFSKDTPYKTK